MSKTKPHQFPDAKSFGAINAVIFCVREKILELYNQDATNIKKAAYYSATVQNWFSQESTKYDWIACLPVRDVDTPTRFAGCILFNGRIGKLEPGSRKLLVDQNLLVDSDDESEDSDNPPQDVD